MKRILKLTNDGSYTLYIPELDEHYHSFHGALQEARHVFIKNGLDFFKSKDCINVLEVGLGTCLNAYLSYEWAEKNKVRIQYHGIEPFPIDGTLIKECLQAIDAKPEIIDFFSTLNYNEENCFGAYFSLNAIQKNLEETNLEHEADIVFYDAFGPRAQPEMWEKPPLLKCYQFLKSDGVFVTYCAKGQVKRNLKEIGFDVKSLPGPPGKREMTLAIKL